MAWTEAEMQSAELIHGSDRLNSDTYRLWIRKTGEKNGKLIDVPGWMVGDESMVSLRMRAARVIRERLRRQAP